MASSSGAPLFKDVSMHFGFATKKNNLLLRINEYDVVAEIGKGAFGSVYLVEDANTKMQYAMKVMSSKQKRATFKQQPQPQARGSRNLDQDPVKRELAIIKRCNHINLSKLIKVIKECESPYHMFVVMENVEGGPVMVMMDETDDAYDGPIKYMSPATHGKVGEALACKYFKQILGGLIYLHTQGVAHRDLKPDNILVTFDGTIKIIDFGASIITNDDTQLTSETAGTWNFWSPEMCSSDESEALKFFDPFKTDVWAVGVVMWIVLFGELPFYGSQPTDIFDKISKFNLNSSTGDDLLPNSNISSALKDLMYKLLCRDPANRLTFDHYIDSKWIMELESDMEAYAQYIKQTKMSLFDKILLAANDVTNAIENASCEGTNGEIVSHKRIALNIETKLKELAKDAQSKTKHKVDVLRSSKQTAVKIGKESRKERISREKTERFESEGGVESAGDGAKGDKVSLCRERTANCLCTIV